MAKDVVMRMNGPLRCVLALGLLVFFGRPVLADDAPADEAARSDPTASSSAEVEPHEPVGAEVIETWLDSVVLLLTGNAWCSGVVIDDQGTVATAYHCVANGLRPTVRLRPPTSGGAVTEDDEGHPTEVIYVGRTIAAAAREDLALVSVPELAGKVRPMPIRQTPVRRGDRVYGIGNPFAPAADTEGAFEGMLLWSVTEGIISAVGPRLIQTDAALNPGNSGGPVVDNQGRIVGIASRKLSADNIAFLASADVLLELVEEPKKPKLLGGQWYVGLSYWLPYDPHIAYTAQINGGLVLRDRLVLGLGWNSSAGARQTALERGSVSFPSYEALGALRVRLGRGRGSTTLDAGGGVVVMDGYQTTFISETGTWIVASELPEIVPYVSGRVGNGGFALRLMGLFRERQVGTDTVPVSVIMALDLDIPGVFATF